MGRKKNDSPLTEFEGRDVLRTTVAVTNAGDGLSEAMGVEPQELHHGDTHYLVLECTVSKVRYDPIKDTDALERVHILKAGRATLVDAALAKPAVDAMHARIEERRQANEGQDPLPGTEGAGLTPVPDWDDPKGDEL